MHLSDPNSTSGHCIPQQKEMGPLAQMQTAFFQISYFQKLPLQEQIFNTDFWYLLIYTHHRKSIHWKFYINNHGKMLALGTQAPIKQCIQHTNYLNVSSKILNLFYFQWR